MIWLWLLSGGAKGNHLLQHVREIKGPRWWISDRVGKVHKFLSFRVKMWRWRRRCIIKRAGCDKTVLMQERMAVCAHVVCVCWSFGLCVCWSSQITSTCCFIAFTGATAWIFFYLCVTIWHIDYEHARDLFCFFCECQQVSIFPFLWNVECPSIPRLKFPPYLIFLLTGHNIFKSHVSSLYKIQLYCAEILP